MPKHFISAHVTLAINMAYLNSTTGTPLNVQAHDVKGISTSLRARTVKNFDDVIKAGQWSNPCTFCKYYQIPMKAVQGSLIHNLKCLLAAGIVIDYIFKEVRKRRQRQMRPGRKERGFSRWRGKQMTRKGHFNQDEANEKTEKEKIRPSSLRSVWLSKDTPTNCVIVDCLRHKMCHGPWKLWTDAG